MSKETSPIRVDKNSVIKVDGDNARIAMGDSAIIDSGKMKIGVTYPAVLNGKTFLYCKVASTKIHVYEKKVKQNE